MSYIFPVPVVQLAQDVEALVRK